MENVVCLGPACEMQVHLEGMQTQLGIFLSISSPRLGWVRWQYYTDNGLKQLRKTNVRCGQGKKAGKQASQLDSQV